MSGILIVLAGAGGLCALLTVPAWHRERRMQLAARKAASRRREVLEALQARISDELHLKRTPQLTFAYDPSVERGVRMTKLIDELVPDEE